MAAVYLAPQQPAGAATQLQTASGSQEFESYDGRAGSAPTPQQ